MRQFLSLLMMTLLLLLASAIEERVLAVEKVEDWKAAGERTTERFGLSKMIDFFLKNPNVKLEQECFAKMEQGESIDFVIDLAPSPSLDRVDKLAAESPVALHLERPPASGHGITTTPASQAYFDAIETFIEAVTYGMKPALTHSVVYDEKNGGNRFYLRGREIDASFRGEHFSDEKRNLLTLWPLATKSAPETFYGQIVENNLGRMTKLALWNRDNGLPTVLSSSRRSKPIYTVVITDGASGATIRSLLTADGDLSRTTVIDIGNHRFIKRLAWDDMKQLASFVTLSAPQQLVMMADTTRMLACFAEEKAKE